MLVETNTIRIISSILNKLNIMFTAKALLFFLTFITCNPIVSYAGDTFYLTPSEGTSLPGSIRTIYAVSKQTLGNIEWTASGGNISGDGATAVWHAPLQSGTYTITASITSDKSTSAFSTMTVVANAQVRISCIPSYVVLHRNQPISIQSLVHGNTNTKVTWKSSGGNILGTGREVVFSSESAGIFYITATSDVDNKLSFTSTIIVTNNDWHDTVSKNKSIPIDSSMVSNGTLYDVYNEDDLDTVPWLNLKPGDMVRLHKGIYHRQILLSVSGTPDNPIRICGVPDSYGNLPVLSGENAHAVKGISFGIGSANLQQFGGIIVSKPGNYYQGDSSPRHIIIEGLKIKDFNQSNSYHSLEKNIQEHYHKGSAAIRIQNGYNISIRGCDIENNGNGLFTMSSDVESRVTRNLLVEGNYFHNNGVDRSYSQHQAYIQAFGLVVQGNYFDKPLPSSEGGQLKTRAVNEYIRYNYFEPGLRILDIVEPQDSTPLVFPWIGLAPRELASTSKFDVVSNYESLQNHYIYGNIIHNSGAKTSSFIVHCGSDYEQSYNSGGGVYFYYNTSHINGGFGFVDAGPYGTKINKFTTWPFTYATNNIFHIENKPHLDKIPFYWNRYTPDRVYLDLNLISRPLGIGASSGIRFKSPEYPDNVWQGNEQVTHVYGMQNLINDNSIPYNSTNYIPISGGTAIGKSRPLPDFVRYLPPLMQYNMSTHKTDIRLSINDLGAIESN